MSWLDDIGGAASKSFAGDKLVLAAVVAGVAVAAGVAWWLLGQFGVVDPVFGCAKCEAAKKVRLVLVEFADREKSMAAFTGTRPQYVNLGSYGMGDPQVPTSHQTYRRPPIVVKVSPPMAVTVTLRLTRTESQRGFPDGSAVLSAREQAIEHLQWKPELTMTVETDANGEGKLEPGMVLPQTAGFVYRVEGSVGGKPFVRSSNAVAVKRRFAIRQVVRYAAGQAAAAAAIAQLRPILEPLDIEFHEHPAASGPELGVHECDNTAIIRYGADALNEPPEVRAFNPYSLAIVVGEFAATQLVQQTFEIDLPRGLGRGFPDEVDIVLKAGDADFTLVPLTGRSPFVSGSVSHDAGPGRIDLQASDVRGVTRFASRVRVNLTHLRSSIPSEATTLTVSVKLEAMDSWAVGWAFGDGCPVIWLNMFDPRTNAVLDPPSVASLVLHELGHKLRLTSDGSTVLDPDPPAHFYTTGQDGVGHVGPHCSYGIDPGMKLSDDLADETASCTMWGANTGLRVFCPECRTTLRKVNLAPGL